MPNANPFSQNRISVHAMHLRRRLVSQNILEPPRLKKSLTKRPKLTETLQNG